LVAKTEGNMLVRGALIPKGVGAPPNDLQTTMTLLVRALLSKVGLALAGLVVYLFLHLTHIDRLFK
jgi:hypothetical protein